MNPNEPTRFFKGYSVWMLRFKDIPVRLLMETSKTSISAIRSDLLTPESDTNTCTVMAIEARKVFTDNSWTIVKQKSWQKHTTQCIQITQLYKIRKNGSASPKGSGAAGKARNPKKRAFSLPYISYNLHYTKYYKNQKQRPLLLRFAIGADFGSLCCSFISFRLGRVDHLPSRYHKIQLDKTAFMRASIASDFTAVYPAAVFRSTRRSLHSKRAPLSYSLLRCQTVQRPLRWSQSTVPPEPPDSLHLPTR